MAVERRVADAEKEKNGVIKRGQIDGSGCLAFSRTFPTCLKDRVAERKYKSVPWVALQ